MDCETFRTLKVGDGIDWYETFDGKRTGFRLGYTVSRIHRKQQRIWGHANNGPYWKHNATELLISQVEK